MDKLWYSKAAKNWYKALPIGNGITGVMVYGGKRNETLCFNDTALWSGYPKNQDNPESLKHLDEVRKLIFEGRNKEAQDISEKKLTGHYSESYLPLGDLKIRISGGGSGAYKRELDISKAVHTVICGNTERKAFVSYPDKVAVYRIENKNKISAIISANSQMPYNAVVFEKGLELSGKAPDYVAPNYLFTEKNPIRYGEDKGMGFALRAEIVTDGEIIYGKQNITVKNAAEITVYAVTSTGFLSFDKMPVSNPEYAAEKCRIALKKINKNYNEILNRHIEDYSALYNRQSVNLNDESDLPSDKLLKLAKKGDVRNSLINLFYNYGKYLTISGSRRGGQALTLQGLWNKSMRPPWSSNYTVNINTQMNYWGTSSANLSECIEPYIDLVYETMQHGKSTAKTNYGCEGFACNHNVDIWRKTAPVQGDSNYMYAPLCGVWLANELYEHLSYGGLDEYKAKIEEIITEAARFVNGYLVLHEGCYVICPSVSPENVFSKDVRRCGLDYASAFEMGLVRQVFKNYAEFGRDKELLKEISEKEAKLYPFTKGGTGINEWHTDYPVPEKGHRHFSPLYAFYPARIIGYYKNPEEREWIRQLFYYRLDNSVSYIGWSAAWAINLAARLHDPKRTKKIIDSMLAKSVFTNLFDVHPPKLFQIDGNLGFVAGINEMLITVEDGIIELLPACPESFKSGEVKGMKTATGHTLSFKWQNGKVTELTVIGNHAKIRNANLSDTIKPNGFEIV